MPQALEQFTFAYEIEEDVPFVSAIVAAGGSSSRMGLNKLLVPLQGIPVLARAMLTMEQSRLVKEIIVVARKEDMADVSRMAEQYRVGKLACVVPGGENRVLSVAQGLQQCDKTAAYICVQDGARPLTRPGLVDRVLREAFVKKAAAAAVPVKDTIKLANEDGQVLSTPARDVLWAVQTPQAFAMELYKRALEQALEQGVYPTDDCGIVELAGEKVHLVMGDYGNIKITTPEDLAVARALLEERDH